MICDLIKTVTADGLRLDGALHAPNAARTDLPVDALLCLHGVGSNFYGSSLFEGLTPHWQALGVPVLWANTRGHDNVFAAQTRQGRRWLGAAFETVDECRFDVAAWIDALVRLGYARIGIVGHSLGAIKAVYFQAHAARSEVTRVIALSPPRLSYLFFKNDPNGAAFFDAITTAERHLKDGQPDALIRVQYPFPLLITAGGYVEKYGPAERYNILKFVAQVPCPTLFTYGELELNSGSVAFAGVPGALQAAARPDQRLDVVAIPEADHNYQRTIAPLAIAVNQWLQQP